jgi:hypothetical protein
MWPCRYWDTFLTGFWLRCRGLRQGTWLGIGGPTQGPLVSTGGAAEAQEVMGCVPIEEWRLPLSRSPIRGSLCHTPHIIGDGRAPSESQTPFTCCWSPAGIHGIEVGISLVKSLGVCKATCPQIPAHGKHAGDGKTCSKDSALGHAADIQ